MSSRIDNLASCFTAVEALIEHSKDVSQDPDISVIALFDHEEVIIVTVVVEVVDGGGW